jgi:antitoxin VapB
MNVHHLATPQRVRPPEAVEPESAGELQRIEDVPSLVERGIAFVRALHASSAPTKAQAAERAFIDGLYGEP